MVADLKSTTKRRIKDFAIRAGLEFVARTDLGRWLPEAAGRGVIFTLHHVRPARNYDFEPNEHLAITPDFLDIAIKEALACGLRPVALHELPALLADPSDPRKFMCFTLDDGYRNNAQYAAPVFRKHNVPYTIFITPGFVERTRIIWWETVELLVRTSSNFRFDFGAGEEVVDCTNIHAKFAVFERMAEYVQRENEDRAVAIIEQLAVKNGINPIKIVDDEVMDVGELQDLLRDPLAHLGAHTITHPNLTRVSNEQLYEEISQSMRRVGEYCGRAITTLAYPYGGRHAVGARETRVAQECGLTVAVTTQPGVLEASQSSAFAEYPRVSLNGLYQDRRYVRALVSGLPFKMTGMLQDNELVD